MSGETRTIGGDLVDTVYPYVQVKGDLLNPLIWGMRRAYASINPFAMQQMPTQERQAFGLRWGNAWYSPDVYPNAVNFHKMFPGHYDPLKELSRPASSFQQPKYAPGQFSYLVLTADKLPRGCTRAIQAKRRCLMVNGPEACNQEVQDIVDICPNWALDSLKEKERFAAKALAIRNIQYKKAMEVSSYNEGRTLADVSDRIWTDGERERLRPDSMWADERYAKITQAEINEAKARVAARNKQAGKSHGTAHEAEHHEHHYDHIHNEKKQPRPLYP
eukprot:TRINITY_DN0_c1893_g1_i5.p1 TRINITY_DN0_c1893_g1~~TRINITY_DN0_c1893_g1_i5.p1  ORF type:complete len:275 (-),score=76.59 TRINITY_DN0_c1893_g1_i5:109-933(-)